MKTTKTTKRTARFHAINASGERVEGAHDYEAVGTYARGRLVSVDLFRFEDGERRLVDLDVRPEAEVSSAAAWLALESGISGLMVDEAKARHMAACRARGWS